MLKRCATILFSFALSVLAFESAFGSDMNTDAREQCRVQLSGAYLDFMNDLDVLKGNLSSTSESVFRMKARRKITEKQLGAQEAHNEAQQIPAAELDEKLLGLRYELDTANREIADLDARIIEIKAQVVTKEKDFQSLKERVKPVFIVTNAKLVNPAAYPLVLQYRHPCDRFEQLCPLPSAQSSALLIIAKTLADRTPCEHYANMRKN